MQFSMVFACISIVCQHAREQNRSKLRRGREENFCRSTTSTHTRKKSISNIIHHKNVIFHLLIRGKKIANSKNKKSESRNMQAVAKKSFSYQNRHISPCEGRLSETSLVSASLSVADILREFSASLPEFFLEFLVGQKNYLQGRSSDICKKN
jgi:hypothetical protein